MEPLANTWNQEENFNDETDFIDPVIHGIKHARDNKTPGSSNALNRSSIDSLYNFIVRHEMYEEYMKNAKENGE